MAGFRRDCENHIHIRQTDAGVEYRVGGPDGERVATDAG